MLAKRIDLGKYAAELLARGEGRDEDELRALVRDGKEARDEFILANRGLVYDRVFKLTESLFDARRIARGWAGVPTSVPVTQDRTEVIEELVAEGTVALIVAVDHFDWRKGHKFSTFAVRHIDGAIKRRFTKDKKRPEATAASTMEALFSQKDFEHGS
jgi:RNA polymerase primary sigma factor